MSVPVRLTEPALADLLAINDYYLLEVSDKVAAKIIDTLELAVNSLADLKRGTVPKELLVLGIRQYRELITKPYRIIYQKLPIKSSFMPFWTGAAICKRHLPSG